MSVQLSQRERILAAIVGSIVIVLLNLFVLSFFFKNHRKLREDLAAKTMQLEAMRSLFSDQALWAERDAWLKKNQPKLANEGTAGGQLLQDIRESAKKANVQVLEPRIEQPERRPQTISVPVSIETRSSVAELRNFLYEMQAPDRFLVFETANLQVDKENKEQLHGKFRIARWFAPR